MGNPGNAFLRPVAAWLDRRFVAEIEIEAGPLMVVRAVERRHLRPFQPPLKDYPSFSSNLLHRNMFG
jgi:hypothetical protein